MVKSKRVTFKIQNPGERFMYANSVEAVGDTVKQGIKTQTKAHEALFSEVLNQQMEDSLPSAYENTPKTSADKNRKNAGDDRVLVGTLSKQNPSVSNLLIKHPVYGKDCWNIIHSQINRDKTYRKVQEGAAIYVNPKTLEIMWNSEIATAKEVQTTRENPKGMRQVCLGTISKTDPTVSHLLINHPVYAKECWNILSSSLNRAKSYTSIPNNATVYLDAETQEITWQEKKSSTVNALPKTPFINPTEQKQAVESDLFSAGLAKAVKPYIGKSYNEINCFELLANGLEAVGIQYRGPGGLGGRLMKMAMERGLPENHYLSGEGLVETSGSMVYTKSVPKIRNSKAEANAFYKEIEPLLDKGLILSFSTPSRGHTGIISKQENLWTYINSGNMDHRMGGRGSKGVGEEFLAPEIRNWFTLAASKGEALQITVGRLHEDKLKGNLKPEAKNMRTL